MCTSSFNFSVTTYILYTMSTYIVYKRKALKIQFKELQFQIITFSLGHQDAFLCSIRSTDFKIPRTATIPGVETGHSQSQTRQ